MQGLEYYRANPSAPGVLTAEIDGYRVQHIVPVAAFDVDVRKVGKPLNQAIFALPNCCMLMPGMPDAALASPALSSIIVQQSPRFDGVAPHMVGNEDDAERFCPVKLESPAGISDVFGSPCTLADVPPEMLETWVEHCASALTRAGAHILVLYLPVGSQSAVEFWALVALRARVAVVNALPVFIASNPAWGARFAAAGVPIMGDDIRSQLGASIFSQMVTELAVKRGHTVKTHVQVNWGGNTDFHNMKYPDRLESKGVSKRAVITSVHDNLGNNGGAPPEVFAGPATYIRHYGDTKTAYFEGRFTGFGGAEVTLDAKLVVKDSPNSAGIVADAIRFLRVAQEWGVVGPVCGASALLFKHPPRQLPFEEAEEACRLLASRTPGPHCDPALCATFCEAP